MLTSFQGLGFGGVDTFVRCSAFACVDLEVWNLSTPFEGLGFGMCYLLRYVSGFRARDVLTPL